MEMEVEFLWVCKERICDEGALILAGGLPVGEGLVGETDVGGAGVVVEIFPGDEVAVGPVGAEEIALVEEDDVVFEGE